MSLLGTDSDCFWRPESFFSFFKYILLSLSGNSGRLTWVRLQQPQEQGYTQNVTRTQILCLFLFWVHFIIRFGGGGGTPTASQQQFGLVLLTRRGSNLGSLGLQSDVLLRLVRLFCRDRQAGFEPRVFGSRVRRST